MKRITMSGDIGWEVTPQGVRDDLAAAGGGDVEILVSSRGGLVGAALEIFNLIRNYPGQVTAILSGYAMSAASYIPMAADRVIVEDNAVMMIHNAQGITVGDHNEMQKYGNILKGLSGLLANAYSRFTGKSRREIDDMMDAETWLYGEEITAAGFAHETIAAPEPTDTTAQGRAEATAAARLHFASINQRMTFAQASVKSDLSLAAAMAAGEIGNISGDSPPPPRKNSTKEQTMDLKTLKEKHPELVAAITDEATAGFTDQLTAARTEGAKAEQARIAEVRAQAIPGHEPLIEALAADGKSTGADAAMAIVAAEKALRAKAAIEANTGNPPVPPIGDQQAAEKTMKRAAFNALSPADQAETAKAGIKIVD